MSTRRLFILTVSVLAGFASFAQARTAQTTAQQMFEVCNEPPQSSEYLVCDLYMSGFAAGIFAVLVTNPSKEVCLPDYFNGDDARAAFNRFMKSAHQEQSIVSKPVNIVLWFAISQQFSCNKSDSAQVYGDP
jgi:hypothetical protein